MNTEVEIRKLLDVEQPGLWRTPVDRHDLEKALDAGKLYINIYGGPKWWLVRRNGRTQLWKRTPDRFRIPVKAGFKNHHQIVSGINMETLRIADSREAAEGHVPPAHHEPSADKPHHRY